MKAIMAQFIIVCMMIAVAEGRAVELADGAEEGYRLLVCIARATTLSFDLDQARREHAVDADAADAAAEAIRRIERRCLGTETHAAMAEFDAIEAFIAALSDDAPRRLVQ